MKWVVVAILVTVVPYTWITLHYRKPGPAYEPYEESRSRANVMRLLDAGYRRVSIRAERVDENASPASEGALAPAMEAPGGLPVHLSSTLVDIPLMPERVLTVRAPARGAAAEPYVVTFTCTVPDTREQLSGAELYVRGSDLTIIATFERLPGELLARSNESRVRIEIPAEIMDPGPHEAVLVGARGSLRWSFELR